MEYMGFVWLGLLVIFLLIEMATVGLVTIWMAGGALAALILELAGLSFWWQIWAFLIVSFALLIFTRPFAVKYINSHHEKTNYEEIIGKVVRITERVDNLKETGTAVINGLEWTARAERDEEIDRAGRSGRGGSDFRSKGDC